MISGKNVGRAIVASALLHGGLVAASGQILFDKERPDARVNGAPFFGFVRDTAGKGVPQAQVTLENAAAKTRVVLQSDRVGYFYFDGFRPEFDPKEVGIVCAKPGYRLVRKILKPSRGKPTAQAPVEVLCILEMAATE